MMNVAKRYILGSTLDLWLTGLASIVIIAAILAINPAVLRDASFKDVLLFATILNGAHFLASYRMLYQSRANAMRYPFASVWLPFGLLSYCMAAMLLNSSVPWLISAAVIVASLYLALHYTGQTWGMMASLAFIDTVRFSDRQKRLFRQSLNFLLLWQVVWGLSVLEPKPKWLADLLSDLAFLPPILMALAACTGLLGTALLARTTPLRRLRLLVPYIALYFWYALLSISFLALPLIQFFHALQYLVFPVRVEINRADSGKHAGRQVTEYLFAMLLLGAVIFLLIPAYCENSAPELLGGVNLLIAAINIHHFYIDGCMWKISQPLVRDELFAHLNQQAR